MSAVISTPRHVGSESRSGPAPSNPTRRSQRRRPWRVNAGFVTFAVVTNLATYHRPMTERIAAALTIPRRPARPSAGVGVLALASVGIATLVIAVVEQV